VSRPPAIEAEGVLRPVRVEDFEPSLGEAEVLLNPAQTTFQVHIRNAPPSLDGTWRAEWPPESPKFVGTDRLAEVRDNLGRLTVGDDLYLPDAPNLAALGGETLRLGMLSYRHFELTESTAEKLELTVGGVAIDTKAFRVSVILPALSDPNDLTNLRAPPGSPVVLHVIPSKEGGLDPLVDVLELPSTKHTATPIPPTGAGVVREWTFSLEQGQLRRFDFYWSGRHVPVQAFGNDPAKERQEALRVPPVGLWIYENAPAFLPASFGSLDPTPVRRAPAGQTDQRWKLSGPDGMVLNLSYEFLDESGQLTRGERHNIEGTDFPRAMEGVLRRGASQVTIDFGLFGIIRLSCRAAATIASQDELQARVRALGLPVGHTTRRYIRAILNVPHSTALSELPGGTKGRVRRAVLDVRKAGDCEKVWNADS